jgi:sec-independent protein translocase protein TatC
MALSENEVEGRTGRGIKPRRMKSAKPQKPQKVKTPAAQMTFWEHLGELRNRLVWSSLAIAICTGIAWFFHSDLIQAFKDLAQGPINEIAAQGKTKPEFVTTNIVNNFSIYFEVSLYAGLLLASPVLVYHILAFMAPALEPETQPGEPGYEDEVRLLKAIRRSLIFFIPLVALFFLAGVAFAYYLVLPSAIKFLLGFGADQFVPLIEAKTFISQMSKIMFWSGLVFELPIFLFLLAKIRIVTWRSLVRFWKWALVLSLVVAAFITPSPDIFNQALISIPVYGLFWLGVLFARFA